MGKTGRPTKLTEEVTTTITNAIAVGATFKHAAQAAGIDRLTFQRWMRLGKAAQSGEYRNFYNAVKKAETAGVLLLLQRIQYAAKDGQWQAAAWILERRHPADYGRRDRLAVEHSGEITLNAVVEARTVVLRALADYPEARLAVAEALTQLDASHTGEEGADDERSW